MHLDEVFFFSGRKLFYVLKYESGELNSEYSLLQSIIIQLDNKMQNKKKRKNKSYKKTYILFIYIHIKNSEGKANLTN